MRDILKKVAFKVWQLPHYRQQIEHYYNCLLRVARQESKHCYLLKIMGLRYGESLFLHLPNTWWTSLLSLIHAENEGDHTKEAVFIRESEALNSHLFTPRQWLVIYNICIRLGLYHAGLVFRDKAHHIAKESDSLEMRLKAYMSDGEFDKAFELAKAIGLDEELTNIIAALAGKPFSPSVKPEDSDFHKMIHGKTVAVVGPLRKGLNNGAEIDSYDVVVKTNYLPWQSHGEEDRGARVDVSYYNGGAIREIEKYGYNDNGAVKPRIAVLKTHEGYDVLTSAGFNTRVMKKLDSYILSGSLHAIPNAVKDILQYKPSKLDIFNSDFMLTNDYRIGYAKNISRDVSFGFTIHDPALQYILMHKLWKEDIISGDATFNSVMQLRQNYYMKDLEIAWSNKKENN